MYTSAPVSTEGNSFLLVRAEIARRFSGSKLRNRVRMGLSNSFSIYPTIVKSQSTTAIREERPLLVSITGIFVTQKLQLIEIRKDSSTAFLGCNLIPILDTLSSLI